MQPMIDSSGRKFLRSDGTVLDLLPIGQVVAIIGVLLVVLFTVVKPEASSGLGVAGRLLFWSLHVGLGLSALWLASRWLARGEWLPAGTLTAVLITGVAAVLIAAPGYLLLDVIFQPLTIDVDPDPPASMPISLVVEVIELGPWFMVVWVLINLPVLLPASGPSVQINDSITSGSVVENSSTPNGPPPESRRKASATSGRVLTVVPDQNAVSGQQPAKQKFLLSLPGVIGSDVVAVSSDLHYLNVWTVAGRSTVLGSLKDVVADLGELGMQVHRSHWVAHAHVRRVVGTASSAACILSNELRIPVSRRRWKSVREQYGRGVVNTDVGTSAGR
ncbi:MAG: LytTR family DNA-binding domain-containing protein [Pseudomonadota bacterium]